MKRLALSSALLLVVSACSSGPPGPPPPPPFTPAGVFDVSFDAMGQQISGVITIEETDGGYSGNLATEMGTVQLSEFLVEGMDVQFAGITPQFALQFTLAYQDEGFAGEIAIGELGSAPISGVKR